MIATVIAIGADLSKHNANSPRTLIGGARYLVRCILPCDCRCVSLACCPALTPFPRRLFEFEEVPIVWGRYDGAPGKGLVMGAYYPIDRTSDGAVLIEETGGTVRYSADLFSSAECPVAEWRTLGDTWSDMRSGATPSAEPDYKRKLMAFFKTSAHPENCRSCGAPRPCRYHG